MRSIPTPSSFSYADLPLRFLLLAARFQMGGRARRENRTLRKSDFLLSLLLRFFPLLRFSSSIPAPSTRTRYRRPGKPVFLRGFLIPRLTFAKLRGRSQKDLKKESPSPPPPMKQLRSNKREIPSSNSYFPSLSLSFYITTRIPRILG